MSYDERKSLPNGTTIEIIEENSIGERIVKNYHQITIIEEIARGSSCIVYKGMFNRSEGNMRVIIKEYFPKWLDKRVVRNSEDNSLLILDSEAKYYFDLELERIFLPGQKQQILYKNDNPGKALPSAFCFGRALGTLYAISDPGEGITLSEINRSQYSIVDMLKITESVCDAIYAVHNGKTANLLYLDLKPANLFVDKNLDAYLFDFNTVQPAEDLQYCSFSEGWSAPEQRFNQDNTGYEHGSQIGYHTDIFSIGAVLFWLLSENSPSSEDLDRIQEDFDWRKRITPALRDPDDALSNEVFIERLGNLMKKMLQKDPIIRANQYNYRAATKDVKIDIFRTLLSLPGFAANEALPREYIIAQLHKHYEKQLRRSGNYALNKIRGELFPTIKDSEIDVIYTDEHHINGSIINCFNRINHNKHILITGEGGMGKTVSLLNTCKYLLDRKINAIYIPLSKISVNCTLDQYLERNVCGGEQSLWKAIKNQMRTSYADTPNVVLLLDGINEITPNYLGSFISTLGDDYINRLPGIQIVMSSRWYDNETMHDLSRVTILEVQPLDSERIEQYLSEMNLPKVTDPKILSVINTPLLLTLYADVESHKEKYQHISGIELENNPNTAGKILSNYFQAQLFRAAKEEAFDRIAHLVLLEFLLPELAYKMVESHSMFISSRDIRKSIMGIKKSLKEIDEGIENEGDRFTWYYGDRLWVITQEMCQFGVDSLLNLAVNSLHFLNKTDSMYEFLHPSFRDYFAAYHVANEIKAFGEDTNRIKEVKEAIIEKDTLPPEILRFVSDIIHEENAQPQFSKDGWFFPGKRGMCASEYSLAEKLLAQWKGEKGESAQNAIANLFNIMKIGRQENLAWCDFSCLDLRKCWLNKCKFTEWFQDEYYSSAFNGSWINRANFLTDGHESNISAITTDESRYIFSGDESGTVRIYDIEKRNWCDTIQLQSNKVIDLAWNNNESVLAVLYENIIFCYSIVEKRDIKKICNESKSNSFRYVRFDNDSLCYSYALEPLIWYYKDENNESEKKITTKLEYDVPAGCAKWSPNENEFIRSHMHQMLSVYYYEQETRSWRMHPSLQEKLKRINAYRKQKKLPLYSVVFFELKKNGAKYGRVNCIEYNRDGSRVLVAIQKILIEYETTNYTVVNKKAFTSNVQCICYTKDGVCVGAGRKIIYLDAHFSEVYAIPGSQTQSINLISESIEEETYYVFSKNGELKKLNKDLIVQNIRRIRNSSRFVWSRDRLTDKIQMAFLPWHDEYKFGSRYSYETDYLEPLGWRYEFIDLPINDEQIFYKMDTQIMVVGTSPPYKRITYNNYTGIWIFKCSFNDIKGDLQEKDNIDLLIKNGGITNVSPE